MEQERAGKANRSLFSNNEEIVPTVQSSKEKYLQNISSKTTVQVGRWKPGGSPAIEAQSAPVAALTGVE